MAWGLRYKAALAECGVARTGLRMTLTCLTIGPSASF